MNLFYTIFFLLYLTCFASLPSHANQQHSLNRLRKAKLNGKGAIDKNFYEEVRIIDDTKILSQEGLKEADKIDRLPGQPHVKFTQYGGYITVDEAHGRAFYYYFVEAEHSPETKPLLLWLNGGPGCSSLAYGAMQELGPFRVNSDGKTLFHNPYAWNKVANVLFVESPAGVGFSYTNTSSDLDLSGDKQTADDNYVFLANWINRFPEYKNRDFYLSGESYAGHYVPQFAHNIIKHNEIGKNKINLKGIIIGNAVIHDVTDEFGMYDYFWTHALISDETIWNIRRYCDFSPNATTQPKQCSKAAEEADANVNPIDIYNLYAPICLNSSLTDEPKQHSNSLTIDPCADYYGYAYLNDPAVQKALHANVTKIKYDWQPCSDVIQVWNDSPSTIIPLLKEFLAKGLRVWVFSGDTDGRVPVTSTRYSLRKLRLPVKTKYYPWYNKQEVGGYSVVYKGDLTFATVRGSGHQVPSYQARRALALIKHFLDGTPLPNH